MVNSYWKNKMIGLVVTFMLITNSSLYSQYLNELLVTNDTYEFSYGYNFDGPQLVGIHAYRDSATIQQGWTGIQFKRYDSNYNVDIDTRFYNPNYSYYASWHVEFDGDAYYTGGYRFNNPNPDTSVACMYKYTPMGDLIWLREYYLGHEDMAIKYCHFKNDSLYAAASGKEGINGNLTVKVMSLDTAGNIGWSQTIASGNDDEALISFWPTSDSGFILSTYKQYGVKISTIIYKLDSLGEEEWTKELGYPVHEHYAAVHEMPDGNYIAYGSSDEELQARKQSWLVKLSSQGTILMDTIFNYSTGFDIYGQRGKPLFLSDEIQLTGGLFDDEFSSIGKSYIARYDYDFNEIWKRVYYQRDNSSGFGFQKDLGNGFTLFAGYSWLDDPNLNTHDDWILVLDSMGCDIANCNLGLEDPSDELQLKLYPVPAIRTLNIDFSKNQSFPLKAQIISASGQQIDEYKLSSNLNTIDIRHLDNGLYLLILSDDTGLYRKKKFVVER